MTNRPARRPASRPTNDAASPMPGARSAVLAALPSWVVARVVVAIALVTSRVIVDRGVDDPLARQTARHGLLAWDGSFYADIAQYGYAQLPREALRFFPLTPMLGHAVGRLGVGPRVGVVVVANLAALAAGALIWLLVRREGFGDAGTARRATWFLALMPAAFVLVFGYAEAVFLALALGGLLAARNRRWWLVALLGATAGLSRPSGFIVAVPAFVEAARALRTVGCRELVMRAVAVAAPFAGAGLFLVWVGNRFGDAFLPYRIQTRANLKGAFANPVTSILDAVGGFWDGRIGTGLHVPWMILAVALTVVAFRKLPASYAWFTTVALASAVTSSNLDSFERYALVAFPLVIVVAILAADRRVERTLLGLSGLAMTGYAILALTHAYVP